MKKTDYYEICKQKLKYLNYSERTIDNYILYIKKFLNNIQTDPSRITSNDFQYYLHNYNFTSISQQNQIINSIKFFCEKVLNKNTIK
jgi:Phage integrase, N-terminal SAM-like domain